LIAGYNAATKASNNDSDSIEQLAKLEEFVKFCEAMRADKLLDNNNYPHQPLDYQKNISNLFIIIRPVCRRRMMFSISGHLPWRHRKKRKDR